MLENTSFHSTRLMGILNITPDSYFDGARHLDPEKAIAHAQALVAAGADIIDIGAESTRPPQSYNPDASPHSFQVEESIEIERLRPVLEPLSEMLSIPFSIDTTKPSVARYACACGASMINDVRGFRDPSMRAVAAESGVAVCVVHMQGTPSTMQINPNYPNGVVTTLLQFFEKQVRLLSDAGVAKENIYLDPGIGFGKTVAHNFEILHNLQRFDALGFPLILGTSRKMFLSKTLKKPTHQLLAGTLGINALLIAQGVAILRIHDVAEHHDLRQVISVLKGDSKIFSVKDSK